MGVQPNMDLSTCTYLWLFYIHGLVRKTSDYIFNFILNLELMAIASSN